MLDAVIVSNQIVDLIQGPLSLCKRHTLNCCKMLFIIARDTSVAGFIRKGMSITKSVKVHCKIIKCAKPFIAFKFSAKSNVFPKKDRMVLDKCQYLYFCYLC